MDPEEKEELEIVIVDDTPEEDQQYEEPVDLDEEADDDDNEEEIASYSKGVKKRIDSLTKKYHDERRAREATQREKDEALRLAETSTNKYRQAFEESNNLKRILHDGERVLVDEGKQRIDSTIIMHRKAAKDAFDAGDSEALVEANEHMAAAYAERERLNGYQPTEFKPQAFVEEAPAQQQQQPPAPDERTKKWMEKNTWFTRNQEMTGFALGLDSTLQREKGIMPTEDRYWETVDSEMKKRFPEHFSDDDGQEQRTEKKVTVASSKRTQGQKSRTVQLTKSQVSVAQRLGIPLEVYASEYIKENNDA